MQIRDEVQELRGGDLGGGQDRETDKTDEARQGHGGQPQEGGQNLERAEDDSDHDRARGYQG